MIDGCSLAVTKFQLPSQVNDKDCYNTSHTETTSTLQHNPLDHTSLQMHCKNKVLHNTYLGLQLVRRHYVRTRNSEHLQTQCHSIQSTKRQTGSRLMFCHMTVLTCHSTVSMSTFATPLSFVYILISTSVSLQCISHSHNQVEPTQTHVFVAQTRND